LSGDGSALIVSRQIGDGMFEAAVDVYNAQSGALVGRLTEGEFGSPIYSLALSQDGRRFATGDLSGGEGMVADLATGRRLATLPFTAAFSLAFSPDGSELSAGLENGLIRTFRLADLSETSVLDTASGGVVELAYSRDGRFLAAILREPQSGHSQATVIWNRQTRQAVMRRNHEGPLFEGYFALAFSDADRKLVLTAQTNRTDVLDIAPLTSDIRTLVREVCTLQLAPGERQFSALEIFADPLLQTQWRTPERDVCGAVAGATARTSLSDAAAGLRPRRERVLPAGAEFAASRPVP
jgi:hypothetical protein